MSMPSAPPDWHDPFGVAPAADGDDTGWLVTFSDLVLQLFAFVLVAAVCGAAARSSPAVSDVVTPPVSERAPTVVEERVARSETPPAPAVLAAASAWAGEQPHATPVRTHDASADEELVAAPSVPATDVIRKEPDSPPPASSVPDAGTRARMRALGGYLAAYVTASGLADDANVAVGDGDVRLALAGTAGFHPGSAELRPAGRRLVHEVARLARAVPELAIDVAGYTDDTPIATPLFASNRELSLARAGRVARDLEGDDAMIAVRTVALGFGEHHPVAPNADVAGRARNRRVELRLSVR
jgi:chemotaxis protein MotB